MSPHRMTTKYRRRILNPGAEDYLKSFFPKLRRSIPKAVIEEIGFNKDYLHFMRVIFSRYVVAQAIAKLQSQSASMMKERYNGLS